MTKIKTKDNKSQQITIQLKITLDKYAEIQRLKANSGCVMMKNQDYYLELINQGLKTGGL